MKVIFVDDIIKPENNSIIQIIRDCKPSLEIIEFTPQLNPEGAYTELCKLISIVESEGEYIDDFLIIGIGFSAMLVQKICAKRILINPQFFASKYLEKQQACADNNWLNISAECIIAYKKFELRQFDNVIKGLDVDDAIAIFSKGSDKHYYTRFHSRYHVTEIDTVISDRFVNNVLLPVIEWSDVHCMEHLNNLPLSFEDLKYGAFGYSVDENGEVVNDMAIFRIVRFGRGIKWLAENKDVFENRPFPDRSQEAIVFPTIPNWASLEDAPIVLGNWMGNSWSAMYYGNGGVMAFSDSFYLGELLIECDYSKSRFKQYSDEFKDLLLSKSSIYNDDGYIGHGNPNASILFIGQEPALQYDSKEYEVEIKCNAPEWERLVTVGFSSDDVEKYVKNFDLSNDEPKYFCPLHPWPLQRYNVRSKIKTKNGKGTEVRGRFGTSKTWCQYQKLINYIRAYIYGDDFVVHKGDLLDFHKFSFHTDMNAISSRKHNEQIEVAHKSVIDRMNLLKHPFFQKFSVVIAAVGHFPHETKGDSYFQEIFEVDYLGNYALEGMPWINVNERKGEKTMLLIHCPQLTYRKIEDIYLKRIAEIVSNYLEQNYVDMIRE